MRPAFPTIAFSEVRYRVKSWHALDLCEEDTRAAVAAAGAPRTLLLGFSMGGAVAVRSADAPGVEGVLGLAPWLPDRLELDSLEGKRLDVLHGSLDRPLPGIPGVSPSSSRQGFDRARRLGVEGTYRLVPGALHAIAIRARSGARPPPGRTPLGRTRRGAHRGVGGGVTAIVGTVRPGTTRISQMVTLVAVIVPPLGIVLAAGLLWGVAFHWVGRRDHGRLLRRLCVRDDDRLPPVLHAQGLRRERLPSKRPSPFSAA